MLAVELAAQDFLRRYDLLPQSTFFRLMSMETRLAGAPSAQVEAAMALADIGINSEVLESVEQLEGTVPVFWGDFLHMAQYIRALARFLVGREKFQFEASAEAYLMGILLLQDASLELLGQTVSFGSTLLFNTMNDSLQPGYWQAFRRFSSNIGLFKVRDVFSASYLRGLRPASSVYPFGPDAAELLTHDGLKVIVESRGLTPASKGDTPTGLIFVGRDSHNLGTVRQTLQHLEKRTACEFHWLPWGDDFAFPLLSELRGFANDFPRAHEKMPAPFFDLLKIVGRSSLIVTDTYHLAVIGWTLGIPVICITGLPRDMQANVNAGSFFAQRDKRFVFYAQNDLLDFFLDAHALSNPEIMRLWVERVCGIVNARDYVRRHVERSREFVAACEAEVIHVVRESF